jgi:hypothetical protein
MKALIILIVLFLGCTGKQGPVGPAGSQGEPGPTIGVPCYYYQVDGQLGSVDTDNFWLIRVEAPIYDSSIVQVLVKSVSSSFWHEPSWEPYMEEGGIRIFQNAYCDSGYYYRVGVVYF